MNEDDPKSQLAQVEHGALALTSLADNRILSEMVGASLVLARDFASRCFMFAFPSPRSMASPAQLAFPNPQFGNEGKNTLTTILNS